MYVSEDGYYGQFLLIGIFIDPEFGITRMWLRAKSQFIETMSRFGGLLR